MKNIKLLGIIILIVLVGIVVFQNTENVETRILVMTITMPRALPLLATATIGFLIGILVSIRVGGKK